MAVTTADLSRSRVLPSCCAEPPGRLVSLRPAALGKEVLTSGVGSHL